MSAFNRIHSSFFPKLVSAQCSLFTSTAFGTTAVASRSLLCPAAGGFGTGELVGVAFGRRLPVECAARSRGCGERRTSCRGRPARLGGLQGVPRGSALGAGGCRRRRARGLWAPSAHLARRGDRGA